MEAGGAGFGEKVAAAAQLFRAEHSFGQVLTSSLPAPPSSSLHPAVAGLRQVPVREILTSPLSHTSVHQDTLSHSGLFSEVGSKEKNHTFPPQPDSQQTFSSHISWFKTKRK